MQCKRKPNRFDEPPPGSHLSHIPSLANWLEIDVLQESRPILRLTPTQVTAPFFRQRMSHESCCPNRRYTQLRLSTSSTASRISILGMASFHDATHSCRRGCGIPCVTQDQAIVHLIGPDRCEQGTLTGRQWYGRPSRWAHWTTKSWLHRSDVEVHENRFLHARQYGMVGRLCRLISCGPFLPNYPPSALVHGRAGELLKAVGK